MAGRKLTPSEQALIVLSVRATGNVRLAQAFATGYFFFIDDDDDAKWLESIMLPSSFNDNPELPPAQISFPQWEMPEMRSRVARAEEWPADVIKPGGMAFPGGLPGAE